MTGQVQRGQVTRAASGGVFVRVPALDRAREFGPVGGLVEVVLVDGVPTNRPLAAGDRVLVAVVNGDPNTIAVLRRLT